LTEAIRLTPTAELGLDALASVFNEAYEGYEVPLHVDAGAVAFMHEAFDLVPERSCLAWHEDRPVGLVFLGVRGSRGWVGGMGVCPSARRHGVGERLMRQILEHARASGVRTLGLEVLENNVGAKSLYEKLGFRTVRRLEVFAWDGVPALPAIAVEASDPKTARRRILATRRSPEPWQRADETLDRLDVSTPALRAVSSAVGDAVYRVTDGRASVLQMEARDAEAAGALLDAIRAKPDVTLVRFLNVPADHPATKALHQRGATRLASQLEMSLELA
jgi:GNAT superfamily N-acetyltransferase